MDYDFERLDFADESDRAKARQRGFLTAVQRAFHQGRPQELFEKNWRAHVAADGVVCAGAWLPEGAFGANDIPVATFAWFDKMLNTGRELLGNRMITDVSASPTHRRRGLVRRLMEDCLDDAVAQGLPIATLTVSEATIYGRWGFGAATFRQEVELDTKNGLRLRDFTDPGRVELVEPADMLPLVHELLDHQLRTSRGSVPAPQFYDPMFTGAYSWDEDGPDRKLWAAVHLDADEKPDGIVLYRHDGRDGHKRKLKVIFLLDRAPAARLALWQFIGNVDLTNWVTYGDMPPDDPLRWALVDINNVAYTKQVEFLWVRVLDVERALAARPWSGDGRVVLEVSDAQGHAAGRFEVKTSDGEATVGRTEDEADVRLDAETLGSLYLGGVPVTGLAAAGRVTGPGVETFAAMADLPTPPYNLIGF